MIPLAILALALAPSLARAVIYEPTEIPLLRVTYPIPEEIKFETSKGDDFRPLGSKTGVYDVASLHDYIARAKLGELRYPRAFAGPVEFGMKAGSWCAGLLLTGIVAYAIHPLPQWINNFGYVLLPPTLVTLAYSQVRGRSRDVQRARAKLLQTVLDGKIALRAADLDRLILDLEKALRAYRKYMKRAPRDRFT